MGIDINTTTVTMIPIDSIRVVNPRSRNLKKFQLIVDNIRRLGLKKPITVSKCKKAGTGKPNYDLVCGQGRLEAYLALGESKIPARVVNSDQEDRFVMSLVENLARRQPTRFEHIQHIMVLKEKGYTSKQIAEKVDLTNSYVSALLNLWTTGEERLLRAVENGTIPISMAVSIVSATDKETQALLADAYETGKLRGKKLLRVKSILEERRQYGKKWKPTPGQKRKPSSADDLVRHYKQEVKRQKLFVKKAKLSESRLMFIVQAMKELFVDDNFINLLRAEKLDTMPKYMGEQIKTSV